MVLEDPIEFTFSVVVPVYNAEDFIEETIDSILSQDYKNYEVILVDDCSTDSSREKIAPYLSESIRYICEESNSGGPSTPRNTGIKNARGKCIVLFDSDDLMLPGKLAAAAMGIADHPDVGLIFTNFQSINELGDVENGDFLASYTHFRRVLAQQNNRCFRLSRLAAYRELLFANFIGTSSVVIPSSVFDSVGFFDESLRNSDDYDLWLRIALRFDLLFIDEQYHQYRIHQKSLSNRGVTNALNRIEVLKKQLERDIDDEGRQQIEKRIADNYLSAGYVEIRKNNSHQARAYLIKASKYNFTIGIAKQFLMSLLGERIRTTLSKLRHK